jgi:hypothetical protein
MADASKLKRLGAPPPLEEARSDLIPAPPAEPPPPSPAPVAAEPPPEEDYERIDGRSLRKTGRTLPFSTRINADVDKLIRRLAAKHKLLIAEVIERGVYLVQKELEGP